MTFRRALALTSLAVVLAAGPVAAACGNCCAMPAAADSRADLSAADCCGCESSFLPSPAPDATAAVRSASPPAPQPAAVVALPSGAARFSARTLATGRRAGRTETPPPRLPVPQRL